MTCAHSLVPIEVMTSDLAMRAFQASQLVREVASMLIPIEGAHQNEMIAPAVTE